MGDVRLYRLMESTSVEYLPVEHFRELGIEATQVELVDGKLQLDPCFFSLGIRIFTKVTPYWLDKTQKLRQLTFRLSGARCLREAADKVSELVRSTTSCL